LRIKGKGSGQRFETEAIHAVSVLWDQLEPLLPAGKPGEDEEAE